MHDVYYLRPHAPGQFKHLDIAYNYNRLLPYIARVEYFQDLIFTGKHQAYTEGVLGLVANLEDICSQEASGLMHHYLSRMILELFMWGFNDEFDLNTQISLAKKAIHASRFDIAYADRDLQVVHHGQCLMALASVYVKSGMMDQAERIALQVDTLIRDRPQLRPELFNAVSAQHEVLQAIVAMQRNETVAAEQHLRTSRACHAKLPASLTGLLDRQLIGAALSLAAMLQVNGKASEAMQICAEAIPQIDASKSLARRVALKFHIGLANIRMAQYLKTQSLAELNREIQRVRPLGQEYLEIDPVGSLNLLIPMHMLEISMYSLQGNISKAREVCAHTVNMYDRQLAPKKARTQLSLVALLNIVGAAEGMADNESGALAIYDQAINRLLPLYKQQSEQHLVLLADLMTSTVGSLYILKNNAQADARASQVADLLDQGFRTLPSERQAPLQQLAARLNQARGLRLPQQRLDTDRIIRESFGR